MKFRRYPIIEKKYRLPNNIYIGKLYVVFTLCIINRKKLFCDHNIAHIFEGFLIDTCSRYKCNVEVYAFMPDHLHLIISGQKSDSNIKKCVDMFKQKTRYWMSQNYDSVKWQKDYYDHILRRNEDLKFQIRYILDNPVRAGLVEKWKDYKLKGSTVLDLENWDYDIYF